MFKPLKRLSRMKGEMAGADIQANTEEKEKEQADMKGKGKGELAEQQIVRENTGRKDDSRHDLIVIHEVLPALSIQPAPFSTQVDILPATPPPLSFFSHTVCAP